MVGMSTDFSRNNNMNARNITKKTVDVQHANKLDEFGSSISAIQDLQGVLKSIDHQLHDLNTKPKSDINDEDIQLMIDLVDRKQDTEYAIKDMDGIDSEIDYLMNAGSILFKYYEVLEKGNPRNNNHIIDPSKNSILKYFHMKSGNCSNSILSSSPPMHNHCGNSAKQGNRASLLEEYLSVTDKAYIKPNPDSPVSNACQYCGSEDRTVRTMDGCIVCNVCSALECILIDHDKPSYKEPPKEISYFAYKRINHFQEWLSQIQGKETTDIPEEVFDKILLEIRKQKITNMCDLTHMKIKEILKKLRINKFYEHVPHILHRLNGRPIPHLSVELEDQLRSMFKMIQYPFLVHAPSSRKNFLSYSFVLHKCVQLLGHDEFLSSFPLLKSRDKLAQQDMIWKAICKDLGWEFVPSM
jgi:hypothetical protein